MKPRDPKRIPGVLSRLQQIWEKRPDMRLAQLLLSVGQASLFAKEDNALLDQMEALFKELDARPDRGRPTYAHSNRGSTGYLSELPPKGMPR